MKETTMKQIAQMKAQTFGTEVEMNNITRRDAAALAADYFKTGRFENTAGRNGYMTWSAYDQQGREWKFSRDCSIAGPDDQKCEMITPILTYDDMELLQGLIRKLRKAGAKSSPSRGCGIHIHVGIKGLDGRDHNAKTLRNLVNIMAAHEQQIGRAIYIDRGRTGTYCKTIDPRFLKEVNEKKPTTMEELSDIWYTTQHAAYDRHSHYNDSRYHMLNLHATFTKGTIEFRLFQFSNEHGEFKGGLHAGKIKTFIQLCLAMSELAKEVKYASPKPQQTENEKYAMRCWLLRLGFIGEEFETARELLLRNMKGDCAWRRAA